MMWPTVSLDSVATLDRQSVHPSNVDAATPYLGLEHLDGDGGIDSIATVTSAELKSNKFQFSDRHVLFGKLRPYLRKTVRPTFSGVCSTDIIPIIPKDRLSRDYLFYFLRTPATVELATSRCSGANLPRLSPKQLALIEIPLPPLAEQKRIAGILDAADALWAKRREALAQLDTLLQSTFLDMFGDPVTNPMGWDILTGEEIFEELTYGTSTKSFTNPSPTCVPVLRIPNIIGGRIDWSDLKFSELTDKEVKKLTLRNNDLLFVRTNGNPDYIGRCARYQTPPNETCLFASYLIRGRIRSSVDMQAEYLKHHIEFPSYRYEVRREARTTAGNFNLSTSGIRKFKFIVPPIDHQRRFAAIAESVEQQKANQRAHLDELDTLFASLQSRAFRGEL